MRPSCIIVTHCAIRSATSMSCSMRISVTFGSRAISWLVSLLRSAGERPAAGSSSIMSFGDEAWAMPTSSCRLSPCDSSRTNVPSRSASPIASAVARARSRSLRSSRGRRTGSRWPRRAPSTDRYRLSSTERPRRSLEVWKVRDSPERARNRAGWCVTSLPKSSTVPSVGGNSPEMTLNNVVLPAPFGPRMARRSPGFTARVTSATARRPPNRRPTPLRWRIGAADSIGRGAALIPLVSSVGDVSGAEVHRCLVSNPWRRRLLGAGWVGPARRRGGRAEESAEGLVHLRNPKHGLDSGDVAARRRRGDLDDPVVEDRLPVRVEADLAVRALDDCCCQSGLKPLLAVGKVAVDRGQRLAESGHRAPVAEGEDAGSVRLSGRVDGQLLLVGRGLREAGVTRDTAGRDRSHHRGTNRLEQLRVGPERVAHDVLGVQGAVELLVLLEARDEAGAADADEQAVDALGDLGDERRVVGRAQRRPDAICIRNAAADRAELCDEAGERRVRKRVVVADHSGGSPAELVVGVVAETGRPLRPVWVEAEEVRGLDFQGCVLGARDAVEEGLVRLGLGVVRHGDALVTGERADQDVRAELFDQPPRLFDRFVGGGVGAAEADDVDVLAGDLRASHPIAGLGPGRLSAVVRGEYGEGSAQVVVVERPEVALAVRQDADLDRARRRGCVVVAVARGQRQQREHGKGGEQPPGDGSVLTSKQISLLWKMHSSSNRSVVLSNLYPPP